MPFGGRASRFPGPPTPTATPSIERCGIAARPVAGSFWTWREQMYGVAAALDPDRYQRLARAVFGEMVMSRIHGGRRVPLRASSTRRLRRTPTRT